MEVITAVDSCYNYYDLNIEKTKASDKSNNQVFARMSQDGGWGSYLLGLSMH